MRREPTATLADLIGGTRALYLHCEACGHRAEMDLLALAVAGGKATPFVSITRRAVCSACGTRAPKFVAIRPSAQ